MEEKTVAVICQQCRAESDTPVCAECFGFIVGARRVRRATEDRLYCMDPNAQETAQDIGSFWRMQFGRDPPEGFAGTWIHLVEGARDMYWHHESFCPKLKQS